MPDEGEAEAGADRATTMDCGRPVPLVGISLGPRDDPRLDQLDTRVATGESGEGNQHGVDAGGGIGPDPCHGRCRALQLPVVDQCQASDARLLKPKRPALARSQSNAAFPEQREAERG